MDLIDDCPLRRWKKKENFIVKSMYKQFIDGDYKLSSADLIWKLKSSLKVRAYIWLVTKNAVLAWLAPQNRGSSGPNICILCL